MIKTSIFAIVLGALGVWGLVDATMVYPARGRAYAEYRELQYLASVNDAGRLLLASVNDPRGELARLNEQRRELDERLRNAPEGSITQKNTQAEIYKREWLLALSRVGLLAPERTVISSPGDRLRELAASWANRNPPKSLAAYDIPMQWVFVIIGFGGCLWFLSLMARAKKRVFMYDSAEHRLTMPDGQTITPDQITEVDKRKWDKFFVTLRLRDGSNVRLDLLRHTPLEEWVLEIEKQTTGYEAEVNDPDLEETAADLDETAPDLSSGESKQE